MAKLRSLKPVTAAIVASALSVAAAHAAENPFKTNALEQGFKVAEADKSKADDKASEGKCGDKNMGTKPQDKKSEGKCGNMTKDDKNMEGKCGEGKCGNSSSK
ncbi:MAG TPA: hypothetical protein VFM46_14545 [Pseudomonadales bacterium]|nr:hypothetical protein [Pseudomonadales bacterium]